MAFFPRKRTDELKAEIARLHAALEAHGERTAQVEATLSDRVLPTLPLPATPGAAGIDATATIDDAAAATTAARDLDRRLDAVVAQLAELDQRLTAVSRELANQLGELSNDIDAVARRPDPSAIDEETLEELRDTQLRLANEQVRYQIAFRSDLAKLAEQLRRPPR